MEFIVASGHAGQNLEEVEVLVEEFGTGFAGIGQVGAAPTSLALVETCIDDEACEVEILSVVNVGSGKECSESRAQGCFLVGKSIDGVDGLDIVGCSRESIILVFSTGIDVLFGNVEHGLCQRLVGSVRLDERSHSLYLAIDF